MKTSCWTPVSLIASITLSSFFVAWMPKVEAQQTLLSENSNTLNKFSVGALIEKLRLANPNQRYEIIQVLKSRGRNAIPALIVALGTPDPLVCSGAAETLGQLGEEASMAVPALIKLLQDNRRALTINETQNNYPLLSSFIPPLRSFPRLSVSGRPFVREIPTAPDNPRHLVKVYALAAIGQIGGSARTTATSSITPLLQDTDPWVRLNAAWSLTQIGAEIPVLSVYLEALQDPDPAVRSSTAKVIQDGGALLEKVIGVEATPDTAVSLVKGLADPENSVRSAAISLLKIMGRDSVPALTVALKQSDPLVRLEAAKTLGQIGPSAGSALPTLALLIQDQERYVEPPKPNPFSLPLLPIFMPLDNTTFLEIPNPEQLVRAEAIAAIGQIGTTDPTLLQSLQTVTRSEPSPWVRLRAIWTLSRSRIDVTPLIPSIGPLLESPNSSLQYASLRLLETLGKPATPILLNYYIKQLSNPNTRRNAVLSLGNANFGSASLVAVPKLLPYLEGDDRILRGYTATILADIADHVIQDANLNLLSPQKRQQAISEFGKALAILQKPNAKFNRTPITRLQNALNSLRGR